MPTISNMGIDSGPVATLPPLAPPGGSRASRMNSLLKKRSKWKERMTSSMLDTSRTQSELDTTTMLDDEEEPVSKESEESPNLSSKDENRMIFDCSIDLSKSPSLDPQVLSPMIEPVLASLKLDAPSPPDSPRKSRVRRELSGELVVKQPLSPTMAPVLDTNALDKPSPPVSPQRSRVALVGQSHESSPEQGSPRKKILRKKFSEEAIMLAAATAQNNNRRMQSSNSIATAVKNREHRASEKTASSPNLETPSPPSKRVGAKQRRFLSGKSTLMSQVRGLLDRPATQMEEDEAASGEPESNAPEIENGNALASAHTDLAQKDATSKELPRLIRTRSENCKEEAARILFGSGTEPVTNDVAKKEAAYSPKETPKETSKEKKATANDIRRKLLRKTLMQQNPGMNRGKQRMTAGLNMTQLIEDGEQMLEEDKANEPLVEEDDFDQMLGALRLGD